MDSHVDASLTAELRAAIARGRVLLFVGCSYSAEAGVPTWHELRARITSAHSDAQESKRPRHSSKQITLPHARESLLGITVSVPELYRLIAELPISTIITTTYDDLIEKAFASIGKRVEVALTAWDIQKPSTRFAEAIVVKLFGDVSTPLFLQALDSHEGRETSHTLLTRCIELFDYDTELFLGFDDNDRGQLAAVLDILGSRSARKTRILLTTERQGHSAALRIDKRIQLSQDALKTFLRELVQTSSPIPSRDLVLQTSAWTRMRQYLRMLVAELRYSWTVDQTKKVVTHEVPFRLEEEDIKYINRSLPDVGLGNMLSISRSAAAIATFTELVQRRRNIMLVGPPGSGKTTFLRALTRSLAQPCEPALVPLYFVAQDFCGHDCTSINSLLSRIELKAGLAGLGSAAATLLDTHKCVFIIDGLDELDQETATALMRLIREHCVTRPNLSYVASCRAHLAPRMTAPNLDIVIRLAPLDDWQIESFLTAWFGQKKEAQQLLGVIASNDMVSELARRPLFLGLIAYSWVTRCSTPVSVLALYESAVQALLGRWDIETGVFRSNQYTSELKLEMLVHLAVHLLRNQRNMLPTHEVLKIMRDSKELGLISQDEALTLAEEIEGQSGLFARRGKEDWSFVHQGFVDYFCSRFVVEGSVEKVAATILKSGEVGRWIPAVVMAASGLKPTDAEVLIEGLVHRISKLGRARDITAKAERQRDLEASASASVTVAGMRPKPAP